MANPFGEKNIGPWEGQQVEYIPLDDLVLWTENPRDPLDGDYTNDDVIRRATDGRNDKQWQLSKLSKEMGDRFDLSELPTVCRIDDGPKYRVYDGNRRVILAMLRKAGLTTEGQQQLVPPDFPDPIPCNVCDEETALGNVERKHRGNGSWKQYERDRFMFDYRGGPKTVLIRLEELIKAVTKWPALNMRYVEDDVFNKKHLEEMGLLPDEPDFGVPLELLEELVEAVADKLDNELNTRNARNDPASVLPGELMDRIREARHRRPTDGKGNFPPTIPSLHRNPMVVLAGMMCFAPIRPGHSPTPMHPPGGEGDAPVRSSRHPFPCSGTLRVYGCRRETSTTCIALWRNCGTCMRAEACGMPPRSCRSFAWGCVC